jgi:hypothetical protein
VLHRSGVDFHNGTSFNINMEDLELLDELGKGNYGSVRMVRHMTTKIDMAMKVRASQRGEKRCLQLTAHACRRSA